MKLHNLLIILLMLPTQSMAAVYTPESINTVIAHWPEKNRLKVENISLPEKIKMFEGLLIQAQRVGNDYLYSDIDADLTKALEKNPDHTRLLLLRARTLQQKHQFEKSKILLKRVINTDSDNQNGHLMLARIYMIERDFTSAAHHCNRLFGAADIFTLSFCRLEVQSYMGDPETNYRQLKAIVEQSMPEDRRKIWVAMTLASIAERIGKLNESEVWLDQNFNDTSSFLKQWSDIKLKLGKAGEVIEKMKTFYEQGIELDDGLIIQLARAEKLHNQYHNSENTKWYQLAVEKIRLREARKDEHHAADIARYYLYVEEKPKEALKWSKINWASSKEYADEQLLQEASKMIQLLGDAR